MTPASGALGLRLDASLPGLIGGVPDTWEAWEIERVVDPAAGSPAFGLTDGAAQIPLLAGGHVGLDRGAGRARYVTRTPLSDAVLVHPYLAPLAAIPAHWRGDLAFHAGGAVLAGRVFGILAERGGGKSSTLAALGARGHAVAADDMLVLDASLQVMLGPRHLDLRADAATRFPQSRRLGDAPGRDRWRVELAPAPPVLPLAGWIVLRWGDELATRELPPSALLPELDGQLALRRAVRDPRRLLDAASLPAWELRRPQDLGGIERAVDALERLA